MKRTMTVFLLSAILLTGLLVATGTGYYATSALRTSIEENISELQELLQPRFSAFDHLIAREEGVIRERMTRDLPNITSEILAMGRQFEDIPVEKLRVIAGRYGYTEIYLLDSTGKIVNTTFTPDLNFNLMSISSSFADWLRGVYGKGEIFVDRLILSTQTGILNQYGYYSPKGSDYIVEVSMDIRAYFTKAREPDYVDFLFNRFFLDAIGANVKVVDLDMFMYNDIASWSVLAEGRRMDAAIVQRLREVDEFRVESADRLIVYSRFQPALKEGIFSQEFATKVTYDISDIRDIPFNIAVFSMIALLVIIPVIFWIASWAINRRILSPLQNIIRGLERIGGGDYGKPVDAGGDAEVARVADVVNEIQGQILGREQELIKARDELEHRVFERTVDLQVAKDQAEQANRLKDDFISLISHDLRSPLGSANIALKHAIEPGEFDIDEETKTAIITRAQTSIEGLINLIDKLLDISRLRTGSLQVYKTGFDARLKVEAVWHDIARLAHDREIRFENRIPENTYILADPHLYGEVIQNLFTNAIKFSNRGGVITAALADDSSSAITVTDTGVGIAENILPNLFRHDVKTSTPGVGGEVGTGLGLPYCHDIMAAHGGSLTAESVLGDGSTFQIFLPEIERAVLIADDQPAHREIFKEALKPLGEFEFLEASNGLEAMASLRAIRPLLVITDVNMPLMDGRDLIKEIRAASEFADIPLVAASSGDSEEEPGAGPMRDEIMALGADAFLSKPIDKEEFVSIIKRILKEEK